MKTTIQSWSGLGPEPPVCPNCGQWQHPSDGQPGDCLHECKRLGFAPIATWNHIDGRKIVVYSTHKIRVGSGYLKEVAADLEAADFAVPA